MTAKINKHIRIKRTRGKNREEEEKGGEEEGEQGKVVG